MPSTNLDEENGPSLTPDSVSNWYPSKAEQAMCATKAIELFDQIKTSAQDARTQSQTSE